MARAAGLGVNRASLGRLLRGTENRAKDPDHRDKLAVVPSWRSPQVPLVAQFAVRVLGFVALASAVLAVPAQPTVAGGLAGLEIPHRASQLRVDGDGADWGRTGVTVLITRPHAPGEAETRATVRLAWDRQALWALFEVADATVHLAPPAIAGARLFQWDSVEVYVDGRGDRASRMGADDFQFILTPDGRSATLQGDPLLRELDGMTVPKRERPALALEVAGRQQPDGYLVECAIPFAALGVVPRTGERLALDLAFNDWTADHPPLDQLAYDLRTLRKLEQLPSGVEPTFTRHGLTGERAAQTELEHYRPWAWSGSGDFGYPATWIPVWLVGAPPLPERIVDAVGPAQTLVAAALAAILLAAAAATISAWRHRRRMVALLARLGALEAAPLPAATPPAALDSSSATPASAAAPGAPAAPASLAPLRSPPAALEWLVHAAALEATGTRPERLELRAMRTIKDHLEEPLTPAELARALYVSLRTLERHVGETLSCTPGELILAVKMREARRLLEDGGWQVQEVARQVGFDDPDYFARRCRAYFGVTPAALLGGRRRAGVK